MTRKEEIEKEAIKQCTFKVKGNDGYVDTIDSTQYKGFIAGAQWADAHPDKQSIVKYLQELGYTVTLNGDIITRDQEIKDMEQYVKYQKEKLIEKDAEWLERNADKYIWYDTNEFDCGMIDEFFTNFKQAMTEE